MDNPGVAFPPGERILCIEPFSGASGDMMLGALVDLGVGLDYLKQGLSLLPLKGYEVSAALCSRAGVRATRVQVLLGDPEPEDHHARRDHQHHRIFGDIRRMIEESGLSPWVKARSVAAFGKLAEAEGRIHQVSPERVHFHEVGAVDSIVDIVGCMIALESLLPLRIWSSPVNVGFGTLECQHGIYPVPGPATQELLKGVPTFTNEIGGELTTPTGAALLVSLAEGFGSRPPLRVHATGYGAGSRDVPGSANVLRLSLGEAIQFTVAPEDTAERVVVIEASVDDMSPQVYGYFQERAFSAGALDVYSTPIQMKKNRPGILITVIAPVEAFEALADILFAETTTIGLRYSSWSRRILEREIVDVETRYGRIPMKLSKMRGRRIHFSPEFEDCRRIAEQTGVPLKEVMAEALRAYLEREPRGGSYSS